MCCFNRPVKEVNKTKILVSPTKNGRQVTVYENSVGVEGGSGRDAAKIQEIKEKQEHAKYENAMLLPCPLKEGAEVALLDLSKDSFKFARLFKFFPREVVDEEKKKSRKSDKDKEAKSAHLVVHEVGAYFVSVAKNVGDLKLIDPSVFKVSSTIKALFGKHYAKGFGFIVCCFNPLKKLNLTLLATFTISWTMAVSSCRAAMSMVTALRRQKILTTKSTPSTLLRKATRAEPLTISRQVSPRPLFLLRAAGHISYKT